MAVRLVPLLSGGFQAPVQARVFLGWQRGSMGDLMLSLLSLSFYLCEMDPLIAALSKVVRWNELEPASEGMWAQ